MARLDQRAGSQGADRAGRDAGLLREIESRRSAFDRAVGGERVVIAMVADPAAGLSQASVIAHCRELIAGYKVPKQVEFRPALPMTASGKVMKRTLRNELMEKATRG